MGPSGNLLHFEDCPFMDDSKDKGSTLETFGKIGFLQVYWWEFTGLPAKNKGLITKKNGCNKTEDLTSKTIFVEVPRTVSRRNLRGGTGYFISNHLIVLLRNGNSTSCKCGLVIFLTETNALEAPELGLTCVITVGDIRNRHGDVSSTQSRGHMQC